MACYLSESLGNNLCQFYSLICTELRERLIDLSKYVLKKSMEHTVFHLLQQNGPNWIPLCSVK